MDALVGWDPEEYDGITSLVMEESSIWTPDIELLNRYVPYIPIGANRGEGARVDACTPPPPEN